MDSNTKQAGHCAYQDLEAADAQLQRMTPKQPNLFGIPLKYLSLLTLALQNSTLSILMFYSRIPSTTSNGTYSAATAVLVSEMMKGLISLAIAFMRVETPGPPRELLLAPTSQMRRSLSARSRKLAQEVFSPDCWKLSIPAILYVLQNNLQYVAASNLPAATFQVAYQMKILTTAIFSVILLRKRLSSTQWFSLLCLAIGVAIVQIQATVQHPGGSAAASSSSTQNPFKGFLAVAAACFTSGLAGVYFEMVLKGSKTDLWVRNVQLSFFSFIPAVAPIVVEYRSEAALFGGSITATLFRNFTPTAWATIFLQVFGGLITALVIKYSDNILKGFATSLSIVISFVASVALFHFRVSGTFMLGSSVVLAATYLYNTPATPTPPSKITSFPQDVIEVEKIKAEDFELPSTVVSQMRMPPKIESAVSSSSLASTRVSTPIPQSRSVDVLFDGEESPSLYARGNTSQNRANFA